MAVIFDGVSSGPEATTTAPTGPPLALAAATLGVLAASGALAALAGDLVYAVAGYVLAAVVVPALGVVCRGKDKRRRRSAWYIPSTPYRVLLRVALVSGLVLGVWHAWALATELAK